jgi:hypothetical protein
MYNGFFKPIKGIYISAILGLNLVTTLAQSNSTDPSFTDFAKRKIALTVILPFAFVLLGAGIIYKCCRSTVKEEQPLISYEMKVVIN